LCLKKTGAQALGRSRGGLTTRIHVVVDAIGLLIQGRVSAGQVPDITEASALLDGVPAKCVVADKAYDAMALREQIAVMPRQSAGHGLVTKWAQDGHKAKRRPLGRRIFSSKLLFVLDIFGCGGRI
jgi:transposase